MDDDWDLHAVVRSCFSTAATTSTTAAVNTGQDCSNFDRDCSFSSQDLFEPRRESIVEELHDLLKPFFPKPQETGLFSQQNLPISPLSVLAGLQDPPSDQQQVIKQIPLHKQQLFSDVSASKPSPRSKKRKNHLKRVSHVPAESLSSDMWSWRKYGQKPIKGSPYPRGYYKCSTSKGCMARKQVERHRSDPGMFIVTYTGEHSHLMPTHRNSLADSKRHHKSAEASTSDDSKKPEKLESSREEVEQDDDDDDFSVSKMALDDDFFVGLEDFTGECLSDHIPASPQLPWLETTTTTTAVASGGG